LSVVRIRALHWPCHPARRLTCVLPEVQSRFAETRFAETPTLTLNPNPKP